MLKDALEYMAEIGRKSANRIIKADAEPGYVYFIRNEDGTLTKKEAEPFPVNNKAYSLQAIQEKAKEAESAEVWYSPDKVVCVFGDDDAKRNSITLDLKLSEPLAALIKLKQTNQALSQAEIIRLMRTTFRDSLSQAGSLVEVLKKVNFKATSESEGVVSHGKASLGKSIVSEVTGLGIIPEYVTFNFQVYANPCFKSIRGKVECALEPDASNATFRIIPLSGEIENATDAALADVAESIESLLGTEANVKIMHGAPA